MGVIIDRIAYYLPAKIVTNADLVKENSSWDQSLLESKTGVIKRHIAGLSETALDLAYNACEKLFSEDNSIKNKVDCILFCTQSEDHIMPPNSCILHKKLGLSESVLAFDYNLACSGFIYGLAIARGLICSGIVKNVLLINADTYSKYISNNDRSVRVLFGDGAAATVITSKEGDEGIIDIECCTSGQHYDKFIIPAGACRMPKSEETSKPQIDKSGNVRTLENIYMDGMGILVFVNSKVPKQINLILERNKMTVNDIDCFVPHQASKMAIESLSKLIKINQEKIFVNLNEIGNTVSASIPIAIRDAIDAGRIRRGNKILLSGFGVGLSWGTALIKW